MAELDFVCAQADWPTLIDPMCLGNHVLGEGRHLDPIKV
jgi:hypothetical protein